MAIFQTRLVQSALKQYRLWPGGNDITCVYDDTTRRLIPSAITRIEAAARDSIIGDLFLDAQGIPEGGLVAATTVSPSADRRSVNIQPDRVWGRIEPEVESRIRLQPCGVTEVTMPASPTEAAFAPSPLPAPISFNAAGEPASLCICVARLASGLVATGYLEPPWEMAVWDNDIAQAYSKAAEDFLGFIPAVTGRLGDRFVYVHVPGASDHEEALIGFAPLQSAFNRFRERTDITPPPDCCPAREGSFAVATRDVMPEPSPEELPGGEELPGREAVRPRGGIGLAVGLGLAAVAGIAAIVLLRRRRR